MFSVSKNNWNTVIWLIKSLSHSTTGDSLYIIFPHYRLLILLIKNLHCSAICKKLNINIISSATDLTNNIWVPIGSCYLPHIPDKPSKYVKEHGNCFVEKTLKSLHGDIYQLMIVVHLALSKMVLGHQITNKICWWLHDDLLLISYQWLCVAPQFLQLYCWVIRIKFVINVNMLLHHIDDLVLMHWRCHSLALSYIYIAVTDKQNCQVCSSGEVHDVIKYLQLPLEAI